jgi:integrase
MYFQRRKNRKGITVYYTAKDGRIKTVPRHFLEHLDNEPDSLIDAWVRTNESRWDSAGESPLGLLLSDSHLEEMLKSWGSFREKRGYGIKNTRTRALHALHDDVFPYFLSHKPPLTDPNDWPKISFGLVEWQEKEGISEANRVHSRTALRKFWRWLADTRKILPGLDLPLDMTKRTAKLTTLGYTLAPSEVLDFAKGKPPHIQLMALVGYFASLRPQELFALRRSDFFAGKSVVDKECCRVMAKYGLFDKLAVDISRQCRQDGSFAPPKSFSKGLVAVFNEQAAVQIRTILLTVKDADAPLFDFKPNWNAELWKRHGITGLTLHDLRKASIYWLGHHGGLDLIPLKNHARHSKVDTTMIYCRRPLESVGEGGGGLDW